MPLHRSRLAAAFAFLAVAFSALLPVAAQAKPNATIFNASICGGDDGGGDKLEHCKLCLAGSDRSPVLPAVVFAFNVLPFAFAPWAFVATQFPSNDDLPANSRGPPSIL